MCNWEDGMSSVSDWEIFCTYIIEKNRYILDEKSVSIRDEILSTVQNYEDEINTDKQFFRARFANELKSNEHGEIVVENFTAEQLLAPPKHLTRDGRVNPAGIPYLYLAENGETAIAEIKPYLGARITVGKFRPKNKFKIVNLKKNLPSVVDIIASGKIEDYNNLWVGIKMYFSVPFKPGETTKYIPTQYLAELFKNIGYDGLLYESVQNRGNYNLAIFSDDKVDYLGQYTHSIVDIDYIDNAEYIRRQVHGR